MRVGHIAGLRLQIERLGLLEFMKTYWDEVEGCELVVEPHMEQICRHLEAAALHGTQSLKPDLSRQRWADKYEETIRNLVISIPPGMSKSVTCSVFWPVWVWTWCPGAKFICTSYADDLALREARRSFDLMRSEGFREMYPHIEIEDGDRAAMAGYKNTAKGVRYSLPMGGKVTGKHGHFLLSDDPIKPDDLKLGGDSARAALDQVKYRWDALFSNRSAHAATFTRVVIAQRLHSEDLSGHFIRQGAVELRLPMQYEPQAHCTTKWGGDWREEAGELLAPIRFPDETIEARKKITPARDWAAQAQQRPSPEDGSNFVRAWFQHRYRGLPWGNAPITLSVDCSLKDTKKADYTVIQAWARVGAKHYLVDQVRARMGFHDQLAAIRNMRNKWANVRTILIEDKANGTAVIATLKRTFPGVVAIDPQGGKEARASATEWLWEAGDVLLPEDAHWLEDYVEEHLLFPVGANDDCVDCTSQYLNWASSKDRAQLFKKAMANQRTKLNAIAFGRRW